jgi:prolyl-tRNA synthetase
MKLKNSYFFTLREQVKDEDSVSGNLLVRSGMIKKNSSGIYMLLPLGYRVLKKIENIIREEMNATGAQELLMPSLIPEEVYEASGRRALIGSSMFALKDRYDKSFVLGPTHEELFLMAASSHIQSYKDLPFNLYQFQTKFRDEPRPRFGLIRVREFIMKDAYSFDVDLNGLDVSYQNMYNAYVRAFDRMGLNYKIVQADTGVMGGLLSEEFQALSPIGEDVLVVCDQCDFAANLEVAACADTTKPSDEPMKALEKIHTPNVGKIKDLSERYQFPLESMTKALIYLVDNAPVMVLVRSDDEVNEVKLQKLFDAKTVELADNERVVALTKAKLGFAGPIQTSLTVVADIRLKGIRNIVVGANESDYHFLNANLDRDFTVQRFADLRNLREGEPCPVCQKGHVHYAKGIEIGNIFKLGDKYAKALNLNYLDDQNQLKPVIMGSYGIGPGRCMAALVEQHHDDFGILWPREVAPYEIAIVIINPKIEAQVEAAERLYGQLKAAGYDVVLDDRDERAGVKFNDMDLIGVPYRITVGKALEHGQVELKRRAATELNLIDVNAVLDTLDTYLKTA